MTFVEYSDIQAVPLTKDSYWEFAQDAIRRAKRRIHLTMFIIDPRAEKDTDQLVVRCLDALAERRRKGVDVRVLLGVSSTREIYIANSTAFHYLRFAKVPVRAFRSKASSDLHSKLLIIDGKLALVGSCNWSPGGFGVHDESSVALKSEEMVSALERRFGSNWRTSLSKYPQPRMA